MAMNAGSAGVTGLANELYIGLNGAFPIPSIEGTPQTQVDDDRKAWCDVIAAVVILHIQTNALVSTAGASSTPLVQPGAATVPGTTIATGTVA